MSHSIAPADVNTAPAAWRGRTVQVTGILAFGGHARHLWTAGRSRDDTGNCLTLVNTDPLRPTLARLHGRRVTVTGVVIEDTWRDSDGSDVVDFGSCNRVGLLVRTIED
jgi:hypothetical protein